MSDNFKILYEVYSVLNKLDDQIKTLIAKKAIFKEILANDRLGRDGNRCFGFIFVLRGDIKIQRLNYEGEETNLYNIRRGEFCHEALSCLLRCEPLNIVGKATQDSIICIVPFEIMERYLLKDVEFLKVIYKDLHSKLNLIIGNKEESKYESLKHRLVKLLISKESKNIYATHAELAFELDSAREVISRKLKQLEKEGYLKLTRGKIQVLKDLKELI